MKRTLIVVIACTFSATVLAQMPATPGKNPPPLYEVTVPSAAQFQIDAAWKDLEIAQLRLQLVVQQAGAQMGSDVYYDFNQKKFFRRPMPADTKPALPSKESPEKR